MRDHPRDCEHGSQWGKCNTCNLIEEYCENSALRSRIAELEAGLREIYETATWAIEDSPAAKREGRSINPKWVAERCAALLDGSGK